MKKEITFSSKIENISLVEKLVDELSENYSLDSLLYGNILVSLVEAVSNAIRHGNKMDESKNVTLRYEVTKNVLTCTVIDQGVGFDYTTIPDPTSDENIDKPHGRGIFLISRLSDDLKFNANGKQLEISFNMLQPKI